MGIIPTPIVPGDNCLLCWAVGETPTLLKLFLSGIETGAAWNPGDLEAPNGYWDLTQSVLNPCNFTQANPVAVTGVAYSIGQSVCAFQRPASINSFWSNPAVECVQHFTNELVDPAGKFFSGWGMVTTPAQMQTLIELATPIVGPDPRMELFAMDNGEIVVKFCNIEDGTNIKIKIDTALL